MIGLPNNRLGELRRSAIVSLFGPGSIVDFRADGGPVSAIIAGLEDWDASAPPGGTKNPQTIHEPRLERNLSADGFRLPPVLVNESGENSNRGMLAAYRFPDWLQCPLCGRIAPSGKWKHEPGRAYRLCSSCTNQRPGRKKVFAVPVRFIMACKKGHLDEFPWHLWVGHKKDCTNKSGELYLESRRPGLAGMFLICKKCGAEKSMEGIFSPSAWEHLQITCRGRRPWLGGLSSEKCDCKPRVLQRGASNVYFPVIESALSIPPWSDRLQEELGIYWSPLTQMDEKDRELQIGLLANSQLKGLLERLRMTPEDLSREITRRLDSLSHSENLENNIRKEEYRQFTSGDEIKPFDGERGEFEIRNEKIPHSLLPFFANIVRVVRLREVRVLKGFTRINPPEGNLVNISPLSAKKRNWLPAIEVRGEGIFLAFNRDRLCQWEQTPRVKERFRMIKEAFESETDMKVRDYQAFSITPDSILVHTFAHLLMRQLTLECGYSSAALRERLYADKEGMAGVLIYTATPDTDGTLGGLQRQGKASRLERTIKASIEAAEWCSSDPLCIEGVMASPGSFSIAACHACSLVPETSCELFNRFLDRALVVGLHDNRETGYFSPILKR